MITGFYWRFALLPSLSSLDLSISQELVFSTFTLSFVPHELYLPVILLFLTVSLSL